MFKRPPVLYVLIAIVALALGLLVYLLDRRPEHVYFLSHGLVLAHGQHPLFGVVGNYLPTFVHVYAFILLTAAIAGSTRARVIGVCAAWFVIASLFELAQLPAIAGIVAAAVPAWFARVPILDNTAAYFLDGTFDVRDLLSIALGVVAAYFTVALTRNRTGIRSSSKLPHRAWRYSALGGITALGMLSIIGSGGGSSTPDTTPPTVSATYPANAATGVFVDSSIRITFSERMDPATVNPSTFTLEDNVNNTVQTTVDYGGDTVTFTPTNPLLPDTTYTATITTAAKDLAGNALAANFTWSFTTEKDVWQATTLTNAPTGRTKHTAVWTGSKMIVWGGQDSGGTPLNSGGLYDPGADSWNATATSSAPTQRFDHTAIWTGAKMIVWGGWDGGFNYFNNGAAYDPGTDGWSPIATPLSFFGRRNHTVIWTGTKMIVWGGLNGSSYLNDGAAYDPGTDGWTPIATPPSFVGRANHIAVWTGSEMIIWGGNTGLGVTNTGAAYNPTTDSWRLIAAPPASFLGRANHTAVWTGSEMVIWGGDTDLGVTNTGAAYDPITDTWRLIASPPVTLSGRSNHTAVWSGPTGISMIVWGGQDGVGSPLDDGGRYDPVTDSWKAIDLTNVPTGRFDHSAVWTGSNMIVWGGFTNAGVTNTGGRYTP